MLQPRIQNMSSFLVSKQLWFLLVIAAVATITQAGTTKSNVTVMTIMPGGVAKLPCTLEGGMYFNRIWLKNGIRVKLDRHRKINKKGSLVIRSFDRNDKGIYVCKTNKGRIIQRILLRYYKGIKGRPLFRRFQSEVIRVRVSVVNKRVKFECKAEGTDPLSYHWLKDGKPLSGRKYKADLCKLRIKNLVESDAGTYTCVASNVYGNSLCSYRLLVVKNPVIKPSLQPGFPKNTPKNVGENASMECFDLFSSQMVHFRWLMWLTKPNKTLEKDVYKLISNNNYTRYFELVNPSHYESLRKDVGNRFLSGVRMNLYNVTKKNQGYYSCVMCHRGGCAVNTANLTVFQYNGTTTVMKIKPGKTAKMPCIMNGLKHFEPNWLKDGKRVEMGWKRKINRKKLLVIKSFESSDVGLYVCKSHSGRIIHKTILQYKAFLRQTI
ncbi:fibroblast growth factor receptor 1-like isoform X2 [Rhopilema esculentum]|uniref:fibroblast growth factor receptor 1-like isoform X2 n=1 Tax=Rhopilema esculentum TaxID=499914 RepID=UPI0031D17582